MSKEKKESKETPNYWKLKDEDLRALVEERKLPYEFDEENFNRKAVIDILRISDVYLGQAKEALEQDEETDEITVTMKKKGYVKVRFHHTQANDVPYVFIGHNGKAFYVPKEEDIWIPKYLLTSVIKDAVETRSESKSVDGKMVQTAKLYQRFPYTLIEA